MKGRKLDGSSNPKMMHTQDEQTRNSLFWLQQRLQSEQRQRADLLKRLRGQYTRGIYSIDAKAVSESLLIHDVQYLR